jgi:hypothetical protein
VLDDIAERQKRPREIDHSRRLQRLVNVTIDQYWYWTMTSFWKTSCDAFLLF